MFLLVISATADGTALGFVMLLVRTKALSVKDMTARQDSLRLHSEILKANTTAII